MILDFPNPVLLLCLKDNNFRLPKSRFIVGSLVSENLCIRKSIEKQTFHIERPTGEKSTTLLLFYKKLEYPHSLKSFLDFAHFLA